MVVVPGAERSLMEVGCVFIISGNAIAKLLKYILFLCFTTDTSAVQFLCHDRNTKNLLLLSVCCVARWWIINSAFREGN